MKIKYLLLSLFTAVCLLLNSCSSVKGFTGKKDLCGMVTSSDNRAVSGYVICSAGGKKTVTDGNGLFMLSDIGSGVQKIEGWKKGWESISVEKDFYDERDVLCIQIRNANEILKQTETALECEDFDRAEEMVMKLEKGEPETVLLYRTVIDINRKNYRAALGHVNKLRQKDKNNEVLNKTARLIKEKRKSGGKKK